MRPRLALAAATFTLLALAGCGADITPVIPEVPGAPAAAPVQSIAPVDESCKPRSSLRPTGALPAPGQMPAGTYMAEIQKRGLLVLGTSQDTLLFSSRNPSTGDIEGFDVDMGRQIAQAIFGNPNKLQIKVISYADRLAQAAGKDPNNKVDLVADTMTMNCARWTQVFFSTVYYDAGQKVLVSTASKVRSIADLSGQKVCAAEGSTSLVNITAKNPQAKAVGMPAFGDCLVAFQRGEVDAVSTDDVILKGMAAQDPYAQVVGPQFTSEPYGMAMSQTHPDFVQFVNAVLEKNKANGTWAKTYEKWLGGTAPAPPPSEYR
jgi:polar amino acid transport system substrate-binding protein